MSSTLSSTLSVEVSTTQLFHLNLPSHSSERIVYRPHLYFDFETYHLLLKQKVHGCLPPWRKARNGNSTSLVQSFTRRKKSRNLSKELR